MAKPSKAKPVRTRKPSEPKAPKRARVTSPKPRRAGKAAKAVAESRPVRVPRPVHVPHVEPPPAENSGVAIESRDVPRALGAGQAVDTLLKLLQRFAAGVGLKKCADRAVRRPHADGLDDYTERKWGGEKRGIHLVIRDWETRYRGHVSNGTNVDIRAWGFPDQGVVRYWEREQWAIGEAPFRRAGLSVEAGNKRLLDAVLKHFGQEELAVG